MMNADHSILETAEYDFNEIILERKKLFSV
jgi:hypothetical protein